MIALQGTELVEEWRALQAQATFALCLEWLDRYAEVLSKPNPRKERPATSAAACRAIQSWIPNVRWLSS